jgi:hypothetical protein
MAKTTNKSKLSPKEKNIIPPEKNIKKNILFLLVISAMVFCLYSPALKYKFTNNDDTALVKDNYSFYQNHSSAFTIFTQSVFQTNFKVKDYYYRPVLMLSFFSDTQVAG